MLFMYLLSYLSLFLLICLATASIASGLYYLAELIEEYTTPAKKVITLFVLFTTTVYLFFIFFDNLSWTIIICGLVAQGMHALIMRTFPSVQITSIPFIGAVIMLIINHWLSFCFFAENYYPIFEVIGYFTLTQWLVPFSLFVSLNANDNVLPTTVNDQNFNSENNDIVTDYFSRKEKKIGLLSLFNYAKESILPQRSKKSY